MTYEEIISIVTTEGISLCNDFKFKQQKIYKNEFDTFCNQFRFSQKETKPSFKQCKKKQVTRKPSRENFYHNNRGTHGKYRMNETKHQRHIQRRMNKESQKKIETPL